MHRQKNFYQKLEEVNNMIYILCPANVATGGPELLHQLGYKLNLFGYVADMYYPNQTPGVYPVCPQYEKYNVPFTDTVFQVPGNIAIIPEIAINRMYTFANFRCVIWWLSVDNARYTDEDIEYMRNNKNILHLVQSQYALDFLQNTLNIKENIYYLSDYINSDFFVDSSQSSDCPRSDTVLFNPKKGISKTLELIAQSDYRIKWQALKGLTPEGMRDVMKKAKVYIDFGHHPGKDRIPREATICGCHIITNRKGSANNNIDVPIAECYKFDENADPKDIINCIYELIENYEQKREDYKPYLKQITTEFIEFEKDIIKFFSLLIKDDVASFETPEEYIENMTSAIESDNSPLALRYLVDYRIKGFKENTTIDILETVIRIGIGEYTEAQICAIRGLKKAPENYELHLNLAHAYWLSNNNEKCTLHCEKAMLYSRNTPDAAYVAEMCNSLLN